MVSETIDIREGSVVMVWASQGIASIMPVTDIPLEPLQRLIRLVATGEKPPGALEDWLVTLPLALDAQHTRAEVISDSLVLILAEALWNKRVSPGVRAQLIEIVTQDPADAQAARTRWRQYAKQGYKIESNDLAQGETA